MPNKKITELTVAGPLTGDELLETVQGGVNKKTTAQEIADLAGPSGVITVTGSTVDNTDPANPVVNAASEGYVDAGDAFVQEYSEGLVANVPAKKTVDVARTTALPSYVVTPGIGSTRTILTASANGLFPTTDGILGSAITSVLVTGETPGNAKYNGTYILTDQGSGGSKWILQRTKDSQASLSSFPVDLAEVRIMMGSVNAGKTFRQTTPNVTVDTTDQTWQDFTPATGGAVPSAASVSDLNTGTDNAKFATSLGLEGSKYITQYGTKIFAATSGTDTYTASLSPAITSYTTGLAVRITFGNNNTGASTLNLNGLGAKSIVKNGTQALTANDLISGVEYELVYDGTNLQIMGIMPSWSILTDSATITWNAATQGNFASVTLGGNRTLGAISNPKVGGLYIIRVIQDGTGGRTLAFNAQYAFSGGVTPILNSTLNQSTVFTFFYDGTSMRYANASGDYKLANLYLSVQAAASGEQRPLFIDDTGKIQKTTITKLDETNKKITITGLNTSHAVVFEILNNSLDVIARAYNDQQFEFGGTTMVISVADAIVSGAAYIEINSNQADAFKVIDKASNIYMRVISTTGALALEVKQPTKFNLGLGFEEWHGQAFLRTSTTAGATNLVHNVAIPSDYAIAYKIRTMFAYATDASAVIASTGMDAVVRNVAGTVSGSVGTPVVQADPATTAAFSMVADNTNKRININFINTTGTGKTFDVSLSYTYQLRPLPV